MYCWFALTYRTWMLPYAVTITYRTRMPYKAGWACSQNSDYLHSLTDQRLLVSQEAEIAKALAVLLVAHFDPATQNRPRLRQCFSVFFPAYAAASTSHQHHLARAFRRAARGALGMAPVKKAPAPQVMRYMLQVLHLTSTNAPSGSL